jgi:hypothetical protein
MTSTTTSTRDRALALLGSGNLPISAVAGALGVTDSAISQLLSQEDFSTSLALLRYEALARNTTRDSEYDSLEDQILARLKSQLSMIWEPMKLVKILQVVNAAKRRGAAAPIESVQAQTVVNLNMPTSIVHHYTTNIHNQVVAVAAKQREEPKQETLVTIQSSQMNHLLKTLHPSPSSPHPQISQEHPNVQIPTSTSLITRASETVLG